MKKKGMSVKFITQAAVIAAIYVVLVVIFNYISFGPVQFRIAEALTILPYFTPAAIPGLFVGCIIANILGGAIVWDVVFGSIATLIGAIGTYLLRKNKWLAPVPPIVANTIIVPFVLKFAYGSEGMFAMFFVTVGAGEIIVCGIIGMILLYALTPVSFGGLIIFLPHTYISHNNYKNNYRYNYEHRYRPCSYPLQ